MTRKGKFYSLLAVYTLATIVFVFTSSLSAAKLIRVSSEHKDVKDLVKLNLSKNELIYNQDLENILDVIIRYDKRYKSVSYYELAVTIYETGLRYDVDPYLVTSVIMTESAFDQLAVSPVGALGLMQIMPVTADWLQAKCDVSFNDINEVFEPNLNIEMGVCYLKWLENRFDNLEEILVAYNMGHNAVQRLLDRKRSLPTAYINMVNNSYHRLKDDYNL